MTTRLYEAGAQAILDGSINFETNDIRAALINTNQYRARFSTDSVLADIPNGGQVALSGDLSGKTVTGPLFTADDETFSSVSQGDVHAVVIYKQSNELIWYSDDASQFPINTDGSDVLVQFPTILNLRTTDQIQIYDAAASEILKGNLDLAGAGVLLVADFLQGSFMDPTMNNRNDFSIWSLGTSAALSSKTVTDGVFDCADPATSGTITGDIDAVIIYNDSHASDYPIFYIDQGAAFPTTATAETATLNLNTNGLYRLIP